MGKAVTVSEFLERAVNSPILDVRSPGEFAQGHLPGAVSFPLFTDTERAEIGTLYKQLGRNPAVLRGLEIVGPKLAAFVRLAEEIAPDRTVCVHCWRGGMRSGSMAWLLESAGFQVFILKGGYKAFRYSVLQELPLPQKLVVLGGYTGSRKTEILQELAGAGAAILDLEKLANHRGSAFGVMPDSPQPTNEQFENEVFAALFHLRHQPLVWVEDESNPIGKVHFQKALFDQIREAPVAFLEIAREKRVEHLVQLYGSAPPVLLEEAFKRIAKRLGNDSLKQALTMIQENNLEAAAHIATQYYDKAYQSGLHSRVNQHAITRFHTENQSDGLIGHLIRWSSGLS